MSSITKTIAQCRKHYANMDAIQKEYQRTGDASILWTEYEELVNMSRSAILSVAHHKLYDLESASKDVALLLIGKMQQEYVKYPGGLAKSYARRYITQIYTDKLNENTVSRETIKENNYMGNLSAFVPNHLHTPIGQLFALQILVQEQLGLCPTVPPEVVNRYLSRKIKTKKGETYLLDSDFSDVFNWDKVGEHGVPWKLWLTQRLEQLSRMTVTKLDKSIRMPIYAFQYPIYTLGKLSEVGIRVKRFGKARDVFTLPHKSYIRDKGKLEGVYTPIDDGTLIFDNELIGKAMKVYKDKEKVVC